MEHVIRNARLRGREGLWQIGLEAGRVAAIATELPAGGEETDAGGRLVTESFVDCHIHLDKCHTGAQLAPAGTEMLQEAVERTWDVKRNYQIPEILGRGSRAIDDGLRYGTTAVRTFADVDTIGGLKPVKAMLELRDKYADTVDIQVCAFPQEAIVRDPGTEELLAEAMKLGADVVGGMPWFELSDEDGRRHIDICFEIAMRFDRPIHMLCDDTDDPTSRTLEYLALKTLREGYGGRVASSHNGALSSYDHYHAARVIDLCRQAGVAIVSNPQISLVIDGRLDRSPVRRGITRVRELVEAGVLVASAQDDIDDPYYPFGKPDQLEVASFMAHTAQLTKPHELEIVYDMVTRNAAKVMELEGFGLQDGGRADLVVVDAQDVHEAIRLQPPRLAVFRAGRKVAGS
jgi:cytosine/creatinine deaminase